MYFYNYFYVHKHIQQRDDTIDYKRFLVSNDTTLVRLCGYLCDQDTSEINLRLRRIPLDYNGTKFSAVQKF